MFYVLISSDFLYEEEWWAIDVKEITNYEYIPEQNDGIEIIDCSGDEVKECKGSAKNVVVSGSTLSILIEREVVSFLRGKNVWVSAIPTSYKVQKDMGAIIDRAELVVPRLEDFGFEIDNEIEIYVGGIDEPIFIGRVRSCEDMFITKKVVCYGLGEELYRRYVRKMYYDQAPEQIIKDLVESNSDLNVEFVETNITFEKFVADGYILDLIIGIAESVSYQIVIEGNVLKFEPFGFRKGKAVVRSNEYKFGNWKYDTKRMVNDLYLIGDDILYATTEKFTGDGSRTEFVLTRPIAGSVKVVIDGNEVKPEEYNVDKDKGRIVFKNAPAENASIEVDYEYKVPIVVHITDYSSITKYGVRSKKITAKWIKSIDVARGLAKQYIKYFAQPEESIEINCPITKFVENRVDVGRLYSVEDLRYNKRRELVLRAITIQNGKVVMNFGTLMYDVVEWMRKIKQRMEEIEKYTESKIGLTEYVYGVDRLPIGVYSLCTVRTGISGGTVTINVSGSVTAITNQKSEGFILGAGWW